MAHPQRQDNREPDSAEDALARSRRVGTMFGRIAGRYDLMNLLMTAGQDRRWRRRAVRVATALGAAAVLDLGTGTGDVALALAAVPGVRRVLGLDLAPPMLQLAVQKRSSAAAEPGFGVATAGALPLRTGSFDAATTAFMVRNLPDLPGALREMHRVLRPGGRLVCLEITRPRTGLRTRLFELHFHHLVPLLGSLIAGDAEAYSYLPNSVDRFLSADELAAAMQAAGFGIVRYRYVGPGGVALHVAQR